MRDERGELNLLNEINVRTRPRIIFHHNFQLVLPSLIVFLSKVGPATAAKKIQERRQLIGAWVVTIRWNDAMWLVKHCVACV